jgi:hypothetical protein
MDIYDEIKKILHSLENENHGCLDSLDDNAVNNIPEIKAIRYKWQIKDFKVNRDNETMVLRNRKLKNIGGNKLKGFSFKLIPKI